MNLVIPSREDVMNLKVGDLAPDAFGRMSEVVEIYAGPKDDCNGRAFACYYVRFGIEGKMSSSVKQDEVVRSIASSNHFTSAEIDAIERNFLNSIQGETK